MVEHEEGAGVVADGFEEGDGFFAPGLFFDLLFDEPVEMGLGGVVLVVGGEFVEGVNAGGVFLFVLVGGLKGGEGGGVGVIGLGEGLEFDHAAAVEDIIVELHGVFAFFLALTAHEGGEALEVLTGEIGVHGEIFAGGGLFLIDLGVEGGFDFRFEHGGLSL